MRSQLGRLFWAALLSGCGFLITFYWYKSTEKSVASSGAIPLAQVGKVGDEVLRRSATRLLWRSVNTGDTLYNGESLRTSEKGEVRIQFDDGRFIDLESDSLIVLQKSKGEIALDLLEGSVFVNARATETLGKGSPQKAAGLVLNSAQGKVDLTGASASLAKGKGNQVDVQVLEGKAKIEGRDGQTRDILKGSTGALGDRGLSSTQQNLQIISPTPDKPVFIDTLNQSKVAFQWKGFPANVKVSLWAGYRRKDLSERGTTDSAPDRLSVPFSLGKHYWKLVAKDPKTDQVVAESPIYKMEVLGRIAPSVIFPTADAKIQLNQTTTYDMNFQWQKGDETKQITLEVASDANMKNRLAVKNFETQDQFLLPQLKEGEYFWRLSAYYEGSDRPIFGKIQKFTIQQQAKIIPKEAAQIAWVTPESATVQYFVKEPLLQLQWAAQSREDEIVQWRFKVQDVAGSQESAKQFDSKEPQQRIVLPQAGRYRVAVDALGKDGEVIGKSSERIVSIQVTPLLKSPQILPLNAELRAREDGRSEVKWENINGAKEYLLVVKSSDGRELMRKKYTNTGTSLKNLMPGKYLVQVLAVDEYGRNSEELAARTLLVPEFSNVRAPTNFKVKVNDD